VLEGPGLFVEELIIELWVDGTEILELDEGAKVGIVNEIDCVELPVEPVFCVTIDEEKVVPADVPADVPLVVKVEKLVVKEELESIPVPVVPLEAPEFVICPLKLLVKVTTPVETCVVIEMGMVVLLFPLTRFAFFAVVPENVVGVEVCPLNVFIVLVTLPTLVEADVEVELVELSELFPPLPLKFELLFVVPADTVVDCPADVLNNELLVPPEDAPVKAEIVVEPPRPLEFCVSLVDCPDDEVVDDKLFDPPLELEVILEMAVV
jgi:hypothetical protein